LLDSLDDEDRETLLGWLASGKESSHIARDLTAAGYVIKSQPIERHRRRSTGTGCSCP